MRILTIISTFLVFIQIASAQPKWGFQGEDSDVLIRLEESFSVVMGTIVESTLQNIKYPFATVVFTVRPIDNIAGRVIEKNFKMAFPIDSLPESETVRQKFISERPKKDIGKLIILFLPRAPTAENIFVCEWLDFREYSPEFFRLIDSHRIK